MELDQRAAELKRQELRDAAVAVRLTVADFSDDAVEAALNAFSRVTPPEEPEFSIGLITVSSLYSAPTASSRKPGNVLLNWKKLTDIVPDLSLAGLGAATLPIPVVWSAVLEGLYVWNKIWRGSVEEFSDTEATTILALWKARNGENKTLEDDGFNKVNALRSSYSLPSLSRGQYTAAINRLVQIRCIELDNGVVWLREWVEVKYT
jgi:hypothetical protein